jgi:hypothetical protein
MLLYLPLRHCIDEHGKGWGTCVVCGQENETVHHMLFFCPPARASWFASDLHLRTPNLPLEPKTTLLYILNGLNKTQQRLVAYLCWHNWKARNGLIFEVEQPNPSAVVLSAQTVAYTAYYKPPIDTRNQTLV